MERESIQELKKKLFEITLAVWRVTDLFPKDDALRTRIRARASEILEEGVFYLSLREKDYVGKSSYLARITASIRAMQALFVIARTQHFVNEVNFDILEWEYNQVAALFHSIGHLAVSAEAPPQQEFPHAFSTKSGEERVIVESPNPGRVAITRRQKQILDKVTRLRSARLKDIVTDFSGISEKTIRNDLKMLCQNHLLKFNGKPPQSHYSVT